MEKFPGLEKILPKEYGTQGPTLNEYAGEIFCDNVFYEYLFDIKPNGMKNIKNIIEMVTPWLI